MSLWQFRDYQGSWRPFLPADQVVLESAFASDSDGRVELPLGPHGYRYAIDLRAKRQTNLRTGQWRSLRRVQVRASVAADPDVTIVTSEGSIFAAAEPTAEELAAQNAEEQLVAQRDACRQLLASSPLAACTSDDDLLSVRLDSSLSEDTRHTNSRHSPQSRRMRSGSCDTPQSAGRLKRSSSWSRETRVFCERAPVRASPGPGEYETLGHGRALTARSASIGRDCRRSGDWFKQTCSVGRSPLTTPSPLQYQVSEAWENTSRSPKSSCVGQSMRLSAQWISETDGVSVPPSIPKAVPVSATSAPSNDPAPCVSSREKMPTCSRRVNSVGPRRRSSGAGRRPC